LKTDDEINELCLQWVLCLPRTTFEGVSVAKLKLASKRRGKGHIACPGEEVYI